MNRTGTVRVKGIVTEIRGDKNTRVKVVSFKKGKEYISDPKSLEQEFPPQGFVFAFNIGQYKIGTMIELDVAPSHSSGADQDHYTANDKSKHMPAGHKVFNFPEKILYNPLSVNIEALALSMGKVDEIDDFYFLEDDFIYGPFEKKGGIVIAKTEAGRCEKHTSTILSYEGNYFLAKREIMERIDTFDKGQLAKWFRSKLASLDLDIDVDTLEKAMKNQSETGLNSVRLQRAFEIVNEFVFSKSELLQLCRSNIKLEEYFLLFMKKAEDELIEPLKEIEKTWLQKIRAQQNESESFSVSIETAKQDLQQVKDDLKLFTDERDKIIQQLRIQSLFGKQESSSQEIVKFDFTEYRGREEKYLDFNDFGKALIASIGKGGESGRAVVHSFAQLSLTKCALCHELEPLLHAAQCTGNANVVIQQVEADWLKYDHLYRNGLKFIYEKAKENPETFHFLILQDFNLAAFECYARPLIDFLTGRRKTLSGFTDSVENLWLFLIPIPNDSENEFGLPLIPNSYKEFMGFTRLPLVNMPLHADYPLLAISQLKDNLLPIERNLDGYF